MTTWYQTNKYDANITAVEVEKASQHCLWVRQAARGSTSRENKVSEYHAFFPSRKEALAHLVDRTANTIGHLREKLAANEADLKKLSAELAKEQ